MSERKNVDAAIVEEAGSEKKVLFGWCMDGNDGECIREFSGHRCSCGCHLAVTVLADIIEEELTEEENQDV